MKAAADDMRNIRPLLPRLLLCALLMFTGSSTAAAQNADVDFSGRRIDTVIVAFDGESDINATYRDAALRAFATFPGNRYDSMRANLMLNKVRRLNFVKSAEYSIQTGGSGDIVLTLDLAPYEYELFVFTAFHLRKRGFSKYSHNCHNIFLKFNVMFFSLTKNSRIISLIANS